MPSVVGEVLNLLETATIRTVEKPWGREVIIDAGSFLLKLITVDEGKRTSLQMHRVKDEVVVVIEGEGGVSHGDWMTKAPGIVRNSPLTVHRTVGPVTLIEVTTPHDTDIVRFADDYGR